MVSAIVSKAKRHILLRRTDLAAQVTQPVDSEPLYDMTARAYFAESWDDRSILHVNTVINELHANYRADRLQRLEVAECIQEYATTIQSTRRHLLLVAGEDKFPSLDQNAFINGSQIYWGFPFYSTNARAAENAASAYDWICSGLPKHGDSSADNICASDIDEIRKQIFRYHQYV
jgi:hypothetical protein